MARKRLKFSDQLRRAVDASGLSRYRIAKLLGVSESLLSRFMSGKGGLSLDTLDALAARLDLRIVGGGTTPAGTKGKVPSDSRKKGSGHE
jgi:transcriptional regulator with XRE-family HTH domain